jgi:hypothetical protein
VAPASLPVFWRSFHFDMIDTDEVLDDADNEFCAEGAIRSDPFNPFSSVLSK